MKEFKQKRRLKKIVFSWPVAALLAIPAVYLGFQAGSVYLKSREIALENRKTEKEIAALEERKKELETTLERLETPLGEEEELHKKFPIKKPGEEVMIIVERKEEGAATSTGFNSQNFFHPVRNIISNGIQKIRDFFRMK